MVGWTVPGPPSNLAEGAGPGRRGRSGSPCGVARLYRFFRPLGKSPRFPPRTGFSHPRRGLSPGDFGENVLGGGRGQGTGAGWSMGRAQPSRSFRPAEPAGPLRLDHSAWIPVAWRLCRLRLRSQVAKAADCKSAIVGSTPTGASSLSTPANPQKQRVLQGFFRFQRRSARLGRQAAQTPQSAKPSHSEPAVCGHFRGHFSEPLLPARRCPLPAVPLPPVESAAWSAGRPAPRPHLPHRAGSLCCRCSWSGGESSASRGSELP